MSDDQRSSLALLPGEWREVLKSELIKLGVEQDVAGLVARRVIERLVRAFLSGHLDATPTATRALDEAA